MKKTIIYLIINYLVLITCWTVIDNTIQRDSPILQIIAIINIFIHIILCVGGEGIIYCIFAIKEKRKNIIICLLVSAIINMFLLISFRGIIFYIFMNQIIGTIIGVIIKQIRKAKKKSED